MVNDSDAGTLKARTRLPLSRPGQVMLPPPSLSVAFLTTYPTARPRRPCPGSSAQISGAGCASSHRSADQAGSASPSQEAASAQNTRAGCGGHSGALARSPPASYRPCRRRTVMVKGISLALVVLRRAGEGELDRRREASVGLQDDGVVLHRDPR